MLKTGQDAGVRCVPLARPAHLLAPCTALTQSVTLPAHAGKGLQLLPADQALAAAERDAQAPAAGRQAGKARPPTESSAPRDKHQLQVGECAWPPALAAVPPHPGQHTRRGPRPRAPPVHVRVQVAQLYVSRPLLLEGRKFHLRLWLVVTAHSPLQAYMHRCSVRPCCAWRLAL